MKALAAFFAIVACCVAPGSAADPLASLRFLVGTWHCTYQSDKTHVEYKATFSYEMGGNWLRESDSWTRGGSDLGMFTYEPKRHGWTALVLENERAAVVFHGGGSNPVHVVYRSIYPDASMTDIFDRTSPVRYTLHFTQTSGSKVVKSADTCVKV